MGKGESKNARKTNATIDTSNLMGVRSAARGTSLEVQLGSPSYGSNNTKQKGHEDYMKSYEARQYIMRTTGLDEKEAEATREAIDRWSGSAYTFIRAVQQGENKSENFRVMGNRLERFIDRAPKWDGKMTYRGIKMNASELKKMKVGDTIDMKGTSSWSSTYRIAEGFSNQKVVFASPTQKHGTSIRFHSGFDKENEVLVSKRSSYRIKRFSKMKNGTTVVWLDET